MGPTLLHVSLVSRVGVVCRGGRGRGGVGARDRPTCTAAQHVRHVGGGGTAAATAINALVWVAPYVFFAPVARFLVCQWR